MAKIVKRKGEDAEVCGACHLRLSTKTEREKTGEIHWCCVWMGPEGQCKVRAVYASGPYCAWHYECHSLGYHGQDFQEFDAWVTDRCKLYPRSPWTRYTVACLWERTLGHLTPYALNQGFMAMDGGSNRMLLRTENLKRVREMITQLSEEKGLPF